MKIFLLTVLLTCTIFATNLDQFAKENSFERDFTIAMQKAKKHNKILVMVLGSDSCPWCRKFERKTLLNTNVKSYLNRNMITLIVDKKYDADTFPQEFQTQITPRTFFIDPLSHKKFYEIAGYSPNTVFYEELEKIQNLYEQKQ